MNNPRDMINIKHTHSGYAELRNFLYIKGVHPNIIEHNKEYDWYKIKTHLKYKILNKIDDFSLNQHYNPFPQKKNTILHFFNGISFSKTPWITTFEKNLPRFGSQGDKYVPKALWSMASKHCKKIIALSDCARHWEQEYLNSIPGYLSEIINSKIETIPPPQTVLINNITEKGLAYNEESTLVFTFVGNQFFSKGGREIINVFKSLPKSNKFELNIVSNMETDAYASFTTSADIDKIQRVIRQLPPNIKFHKNIPNTKVLELLKKSHLALLPTYADTYGYFVLEAQACGCPVITTNVEAMPEINDEACGWIIPIPLDELRNGILNPKSNQKLVSDKIEKDLFQIINEILKKPQIIIPKAIESISRIKNQHDPKRHCENLIAIYKSALH
jgi:glycosyltransferase involved in cell wall biosynthesis